MDISKKDTVKKPDLDPSHELPTPHDMELENPHDMLLAKNHITNHHPWLHWLPALIGLFIGISVGIFLMKDANINREQVKQNYVITPVPSRTPTIPQSLTLTPPACVNWETVCDPAYPNDGCKPLKICVSPTPAVPTIPDKSEGNVYCTQEAKQCPDGSWVGREGPNCEFLPCTTGQP